TARLGGGAGAVPAAGVSGERGRNAAARRNAGAGGGGDAALRSGGRRAAAHRQPQPRLRPRHAGGEFRGVCAGGQRIGQCSAEPRTERSGVSGAPRSAYSAALRARLSNLCVYAATAARATPFRSVATAA